MLQWTMMPSMLQITGGEMSMEQHSTNPIGTGDKISDSVDDTIGGALDTVNYSPFVTAPISIKQFPSDILFAGDFEGNTCTQF